MIIEAKTKKNLTNKEFGRDFFKLNLYIDRLKFQEAIYLIVNRTPQQINACIKNYIENGYYTSEQNLDKLWFFIQDGHNEDPVIYKCEQSIIYRK